MKTHIVQHKAEGRASLKQSLKLAVRWLLDNAGILQFVSGCRTWWKILGIIRNRQKFLCLQLSEPWECCSSFPLLWGFGCLCWARSDTAPGVSLLCENDLWAAFLKAPAPVSAANNIEVHLSSSLGQGSLHSGHVCARPWISLILTLTCWHDHRRKIQVVTSWFMTITDGNKKTITAVSASSSKK